VPLSESVVRLTLTVRDGNVRWRPGKTGHRGSRNRVTFSGTPASAVTPPVAVGSGAGTYE
jgi:hypothetical protein